MNILVINASPYMRRSSTSIILNSFLSGIREAGGEITLFNLAQLEIHPCRGDLSCWFRKKKECIQHDDMDKLRKPFEDANVVVFSTPVYCDGVPGQLKIMIDRLVAGGNALLEIRDNHTHHPVPDSHQLKQFVLISSCGLWEIDNFDPMITHLKAFCKNIGFTFCGALLRPHAFAMKNNDINDILKAAKDAGRELVQCSSISEKNEIIVRREIVSREEYIDIINNKVANLTQK